MCDSLIYNSSIELTLKRVLIRRTDFGGKCSSRADREIDNKRSKITETYRILVRRISPVLQQDLDDLLVPARRGHV